MASYILNDKMVRPIKHYLDMWKQLLVSKDSESQTIYYNYLHSDLNKQNGCITIPVGHITAVTAKFEIFPLSCGR